MGKNNKNKLNNRPLDPMANVKTMGREGMKIIRDIAFGRYNIYNEGHVFRDPEFVNAIIAELDKKIVDLTITVNAIRAVYGGANNPAADNLLYRHTRSLEAYNLIRVNLVSIIMSGGDTGFLLVLANKLPPYKYNI